MIADFHYWAAYFLYVGYYTGCFFSYGTGNEITRYEQSQFIPGPKPEDDGIQIIQGQYEYVGADGRKYVMKYIADENGFHPEADYLPQPVVDPLNTGYAREGATDSLDEPTQYREEQPNQYQNPQYRENPRARENPQSRENPQYRENPNKYKPGNKF